MATTKRKPKADPAVMPAHPTILDSMNGPFQKWFDGPSWDPWRIVLRAAFGFGQSFSEDELRVFRSVCGDRDPPTKQVRELWIAGGRRCGKDSIASLIATHVATHFSDQSRLRPGERALVLCLAVDRPQARICKDYCRGFFELPFLEHLVQRETRDGFELGHGVDVFIGTNDFRSLRGRPILLAVLDECAFYQSESSSQPDLEVFRAIQPGLATLPNSMIVGISSPYKKSGLLYSKVKDHYGVNDDSVLVICAESRQLNPTLDPAIIERALATDRAAAECEWLGRFRDDVGGYIEAELIESAVDVGVRVRPPWAGNRYVAFVDAASGSGKDSFSVSIAHAEDGIAVLDAVAEYRPPFSPTQIISEVSVLLRSYGGLTEVTGDRWSAGLIVDCFAACGVSYRHSDRDRSTLYLDALPMFTSGRIRLLDNQKLVSQFAQLERKTSASGGRDRVNHGVGGHDDLCNSSAGALTLALKQPRAVFLFG
jgi:hypothetical protein